MRRERLKDESRRQKNCLSPLRCRRCLLAFIILHSAFCLRVWGQYSMDWYTIDGGGGASSGGGYTVTGTTGQPDAGTLKGGNYTLVGGFWGLIAAAQAPPPLLAIELTSTNSVLISWPAPATGWQLEANGDLNTTGWAGVGTVPQEVGGRMQVIVWPAVGNSFYRLKKP